MMTGWVCPTADECSTNARVPVATSHPDMRGFAVWYPQMGGYVGKAVVFTGGARNGEPDNDGCFDIAVWHDGEFPFSEEGRDPHILHHCAPSQFVRFGEQILSLPWEGV